MKTKRDDDFQKNKKILKNRFDFEKQLKKNIAFCKSKKKVAIKSNI